MWLVIMDTSAFTVARNMRLVSFPKWLGERQIQTSLSGCLMKMTMVLRASQTRSSMKQVVERLQPIASWTQVQLGKIDKVVVRESIQNKKNQKRIIDEEAETRFAFIGDGNSESYELKEKKVSNQYQLIDNCNYNSTQEDIKAEERKEMARSQDKKELVCVRNTGLQ